MFRPRNFESFDEWGNPYLNTMVIINFDKNYENHFKDNYGEMFKTARDRYQKQVWGRVEDPWLLDNITMAIREGIIGANGFRADYAVIVTWERMSYGGLI